jgi:hypothetical protein
MNNIRRLILSEAVLLTTLSLCLSNSHAASVDFGTLDLPSSIHFGDSTKGTPNVRQELPSLGKFSDSYTFNIVDMAGLDEQVSVLTKFKGFSNFKAWVEGVGDLVQTSLNVPQLYGSFLLSPGSYTLRVEGVVTEAPTSYAGTFDLYESNITNTPIPGAVWLFGTALTGLGFLNRKLIKKVKLSIPS